MLQSKAGIENQEYKAQRAILADVDAGRISKEELFARAEELLRERMPAPPGAPARPTDGGTRPATPSPPLPPLSAPPPH